MQTGAIGDQCLSETWLSKACQETMERATDEAVLVLQTTCQRKKLFIEERALLHSYVL
jgi:hypothetical protein